MKKIASVFLSLMFIITTISIGSITAFAETTSKYWEPLPGHQDVTPCVNGVEFGGEIGDYYDRETGQITFTYEGEGVVTGWEFPLSQEGKDYEIISQEGNKITFVFTEANKNHEMPYVNVLVDFDETSSQTTQTEQQTEIESTSSTSVSETQETTTNATTEKNDNLNTVKILIPALAVVCIVVIVIIAIKKHKK